MTPTRFRECLDALHWTQRGLATILGCADTLTRGWASGRGTIPEPVAEWLEERARQAAETPPPEDWRRPRFGRAA
ncbi:nuclease [Roseomonas chloroacetimidivorans]|uniref:nuclease n=1 Tax=Roseomonas chloroacetimidivorans TaxID=1766656 RepID=UPI003C763B9C